MNLSSEITHRINSIDFAYDLDNSEFYLGEQLTKGSERLSEM